MSLIKQLSDISLAFQKECLSLPHVMEAVSAATLQLQSYQTRYGKRLSQFLEDQAAETNVSGNRFKDLQLSGFTAAKEAVCLEERKLILPRILRCLEDRFFDFQDSPVLKAASIFDSSNWPNDDEGLLTYGNVEISLLINHFQPVLEAKGCHINMVYEEWTRLKINIQKYHRSSPSFTDIWKGVFEKKAAQVS